MEVSLTPEACAPAYTRRKTRWRDQEIPSLIPRLTNLLALAFRQRMVSLLIVSWPNRTIIHFMFVRITRHIPFIQIHTMHSRWIYRGRCRREAVGSVWASYSYPHDQRHDWDVCLAKLSRLCCIQAVLLIGLVSMSLCQTPCADYWLWTVCIIVGSRRRRILNKQAKNVSQQ